jgi:hypothetical protein
MTIYITICTLIQCAASMITFFVVRSAIRLMSERLDIQSKRIDLVNERLDRAGMAMMEKNLGLDRKELQN